jgi:hypothetical protein
MCVCVCVCVCVCADISHECCVVIVNGLHSGQSTEANWM